MSPYQKMYFIFAVFFISTAILLFVIHFISETFPSVISTTSFAMAVMCFSLSYLYPKFQSNPKKMRNIRNKVIPVTIILAVILSMFKWLMIELGIIYLSIPQFIQILIALMICTVFISFLLFEKYQTGRED